MKQLTRKDLAQRWHVDPHTAWATTRRADFPPPAKTLRPAAWDWHDITDWEEQQDTTQPEARPHHGALKLTRDERDQLLTYGDTTGQGLRWLINHHNQNGWPTP